MADKEILLAKASAFENNLRRIEEKSRSGLAVFLSDKDTQDVTLFNFQMSIQNCIDIASHILSDQGLGVPGSYNEMFYMLEENGFIDRSLAESMVKACGFRNLLVHQYIKIDLNLAYSLIEKDLKDLSRYIQVILVKFGLES